MIAKQYLSFRLVLVLPEMFHVRSFCCWKILSGLLLRFQSVFNQTVGACPLGGVGPGWIWGAVEEAAGLFFSILGG